MTALRILFLTAGVSAGMIFALAAPAVNASQQPYAGQQSRTIKALSDQEIHDYRRGAGLGMAKAAELNRFPGPAHLLEFAESLRLSPQQRRKIEEIFARMKAEAVPLGRQVIDLEAELDRLFAAGGIDAGSLERLTDQIARLNGKLRGVHLRAHLNAKPLLTDEQITRYTHLRGYSDDTAAPHRHTGH